MELPVPKFKIGDIVWRAATSVGTTRLPCPDCFDTGRWEVHTPAGQTYEAKCLRCSSYFSDLPRLDVETATAYVQCLTVGQVRSCASIADTYDKGVKYMCTETGVGSGSVYDEEDLFATQNEAQRAAEVMAMSQQASLNEKRHVKEAKAIGTLTVNIAFATLAWQASYSAWASYRQLKEDIKVLIDDPPQTVDEVVEVIDDALRFDEQYRTRPEIELILDKIRVLSPEAEALVKELEWRPLQTQSSQARKQETDSSSAS